MPTPETPEPFPSLPTPTASSTDTPSSDRSYEDLVRARVPLPDSSHRPSIEEERRAETPRPPTISVTDGSASAADVQAALATLAHVDLADVTIALAAGAATVTGSVARGLDRDAINAALERLPGVIEIVDRLRIRTE